MQLYKLNKTVLSIKNNPTQFLNGLTSNSLDSSQNAFLNIHGRIIATFDQIKINEEEYWIVIEPSFVDGLLKHIDKYIKLSSVQIENISRFVYYDLQGSEEFASGEQIIIPQKKGRIIISEQKLTANITDEEFTLFRVTHHIPLQGIDYTDEFVLNVGEKDFVSFEKGCFLGQEPVSKVHNRSRPTWQLMVKYEDECDENSKNSITSKVVEPDSHRAKGFVFINKKLSSEK